jgi:hypothetical protein
MAPLNRPVKRCGTLQGFDFTLHMRRLCASLTAELPELSHIDLPQVAIRFCQVRSTRPHGMLASLTPLRFEHGSLTTLRRGRRWRIETVQDANGREMLYLLSFYLPRFCDYSFREKLVTVIHELWHIGPNFDGDLRRFPGRCYAHSPRQRNFDAFAAALADKWLAATAASEVSEFLQATFAELVGQHGAVVGQRIRTPRLVRDG